jgi:hypothetical protein
MSPRGDAIWNRATHPDQQKVLRAGDIALADMLCLHGLIMNGGIEHALDVADEEVWARGISGYQFYSLQPVATLLMKAPSKVRGMDMEAVLDDADTEYTSLVPRDRTLEAAFQRVLDERPGLFAPVADRYLCPVCGYPGLYEPPWIDVSGSFEICPSCGTVRLRRRGGGRLRQASSHPHTPARGVEKVGLSLVVFWPTATSGLGPQGTTERRRGLTPASFDEEGESVTTLRGSRRPGRPTTDPGPRRWRRGRPPRVRPRGPR